MSRKLIGNGFKCVKELSKFDECQYKYNTGYIFEVDVEYPKNLFNLHRDLPFLPKRNKIKKCNKFVSNIHEKKNYVVHINALKQTLNHGLIPKKIPKVIKFNIYIHKKKWLKPYIDMNTKLRTEAKIDFEKDIFKLMNNAVLPKTRGKVRKHKDIKLVTADKRRNQLASKPNYHTTKYISENLMATEMKKTKVKMNKPIYLGMSIKYQ